MILRAGTHLGRHFHGARSAPRVRIARGRRVKAWATERAVINGAWYLRVSSGALDGYWVAESSAAYLPGAVQLTDLWAERATVGKGTRTAYRYNSSGAILSAKSATLSSAQIHADGRLGGDQRSGLVLRQQRPLGGALAGRGIAACVSPDGADAHPPGVHPRAAGARVAACGGPSPSGVTRRHQRSVIRFDRGVSRSKPSGAPRTPYDAAACSPACATRGGRAASRTSSRPMRSRRRSAAWCGPGMDARGMCSPSVAPAGRAAAPWTWPAPRDGRPRIRPVLVRGGCRRDRDTDQQRPARRTTRPRRTARSRRPRRRRRPDHAASPTSARAGCLRPTSTAIGSPIAPVARRALPAGTCCSTSRAASVIETTPV